MITRYYNAKIFHNGEIINGDFVVYDNLIAHIGPSVVGLMSDKEVDVKGNLIFPTFKCAHTHSPRILLKSLTDLKIAEGASINAEAYLNDDYIYWLTKYAILEYLKNGIGVIADMYNSLDAIMAASNESGIRNSLSHMINNDFVKGKDIIHIYENGFDVYKKDLCDYRVGIHSEGAADIVLLKEISAYVNANKKPIRVHLSEKEEEIAKCKEKYGKTQVELFRDLGLFNYGGTVIHMVHPNEKDIQILSDMNVNVVTCPGANANVGAGICPVKELIDKGINVGVGLDAPSANLSYDMFSEMKLLKGLQNIKYSNSNAISDVDVINAATINGSVVLDIKGLYKGLDTNQYADFIIVDISNIPHNNMLKNVVNCLNGSNVLTTVVGGKVLYDSGNYYIGEDVNKILSMCRILTKDILQKI